jgi:hypothetical protein
MAVYNQPRKYRRRKRLAKWLQWRTDRRRTWRLLFFGRYEFIYSPRMYRKVRV